MTKNRSAIKIKIKINSRETRFECPEDNIETCIKYYLTNIDVKEQKIEPKNTLNQKQNTCEELLKILIKEGWFNFSRSATEVFGELSWRGFNRYGKSRISHVLAALSKEGYLLRFRYEQNDRKYHYIQNNK